jgi:hypothetical protein
MTAARTTLDPQDIVGGEVAVVDLDRANRISGRLSRSSYMQVSRWITSSASSMGLLR